MIFRQLDASGDWAFGKGLQNFAQNEEAVSLNIKTFLKSWAGNCFFSLQSGINWQRFLDKGQKENLLGALQAGILQQFGVVGINSVDVTLDAGTRHAIITYDIQTIYSQSFKDEVSLAAGAGVI